MCVCVCVCVCARVALQWCLVWLGLSLTARPHLDGRITGIVSSMEQLEARRVNLKETFEKQRVDVMSISRELQHTESSLKQKVGRVQGPALVGGVQGLALVGRVQGPALVGGVQGPALVGGVQGLALVGGVQGPALVGGVQGPALVGGVQGPALVGGVQGPALVAGVDLHLWPLPLSGAFADPGAG